MSDGDRMPKIDQDKLKQTEQQFMRMVEQRNFERVKKLQNIRKWNIITGCLLGVGVLSIYGYSIYAVRQENFLDDFEVPQTTTN